VTCGFSVGQAACVYSLIGPPRTGLRRIRAVSRSVTVVRGCHDLRRGHAERCPPRGSSATGRQHAVDCEAEWLVRTGLAHATPPSEAWPLPRSANNETPRAASQASR